MFAKKSLGQNFLRSKSALQKIVEAADLKPDDVVLEVGPGEGILTEALLRSAGKVIAVEKDDRLIPLLEQKFASEISVGKFELIHEDILDLELTTDNLQLTTRQNFFKKNLGGQTYKLIANIPYYITGQLLRKFLESDFQPSRMVLLLQKEVAKRIVASDNKESILSMSVKAYGTPKYIDTVKAECFTPKPKVDSAILLVENISKKFFAPLLGTSADENSYGDSFNTPASNRVTGFAENKIDEKKFFEILKKGFKSKRKILVSNLEISNDPNLEKIMSDCGITKNTRAEDITLEQWGRILLAFSV
ncbi:MAG: 16S rRNA (adenine(1518)-N(6)/adenine(1519)-N(6))-dimethyltransferase RsmA [Candidatus Paceibacterota bacterium]